MSIIATTRRGFLKGACILSGGLLLGVRMANKAYAAAKDFKDYMSDRSAAVYSADSAFPKRASQDNTQVKALYDSWLGKPLSHKSEENLHTGEGARVLHQCGVPATYKIHTHDFYELFLVSRGGAIHAVNGRSQLLSEGSFVLMRPRDVHRYDFFNNADFELLDIGIPRTVFERLCDYLQLDRAIFDTPELPLHCVLSGHTLTDVQEKLLNTNRFADNETACRYILSLFPYLVQLFLTAPAPEAILPAWFSELLEKMERRENYTTGLPCLLALANMSQEHLTRSFRRYIGMTPTEYINGKRLSLAAQLLLQGDMPVIEICGACGFNSLSRFYRLFTERYGCAPKAFRSQFAHAQSGQGSPISLS